MRATLLASPPGAPSTSVALPARLTSLDGKKVAGEADFDSATGQLVAKLADSSVILDRADTVALLSWLSTGCTFSIANLESRKLTKKPPRPFITSTLQQEGSRKLGLSPTRTMRVAQELYEAGFISYMRTDSPYLSATALSAAQGLVKRLFGDDFLDAAAGLPPTKPAAAPAAKAVKGAKAQKDSKKTDKEEMSAAPMNAQEAHEAIRPAESGEGTFKSPAETGLSGDNLRLYSLVYRRTLASVMQPSQSLTKTYTIHATDGASAAAPGKAASKAGSKAQGRHGHAVLRSSHTVRTFDGYQAAYVMNDAGRYAPSAAREARDLDVGQDVRLAEEQEEESLAKLLARAGAVEEASEGDDEDEEEEGEGKKREEKPAEDALRLPGLTGTSHVTQPPSRHTEASFIQELEKIGVGRPSTYSKVFQILRDRGYVLVDKQTLVPTITGMVVSEWMQRHFPALVEARFTAAMETSLDLIARGQKDKLDFLKTFYLGSDAAGSGGEGEGEGEGEAGMTFEGTAAQGGSEGGGGDDDPATGLGLLQAVERKLTRAEIDHKESRTLVVPFLSELGVLQLGRSGAFIESHANTTEPLNEKEEANNRRWKLPESMQLDFRAITREAVAQVMATETTMQGANMGVNPDGRPVLLRSGRFGRFLQIGADSEKNKTAHSLPRWVDHSVSLDELVAFSKLPRAMGNHTAFEAPEGHALYHAPMVLEVTSGALSVGIDKYPYRVALPDGLLVSQVTPDIAMSLLTDPAAVLASQRVLGQADDGEDVFLRQGRFGYYVRSGKIIAGLRKADPETLTLEEALNMLLTRGKPIGSKKNKTKTKAGAKTKAKSSKSKAVGPRKKSAYQIFSGDMMRGGKKMAEVGILWKSLGEPERREWVERAEQQIVAEAPASANTTPTASVAKSKTKPKRSAATLAAARLQVTATAEKLASVEKKALTGYSLYMKERMNGGGVKLGDVATEWRAMAEEGKLAYKEKARGASVGV